MPIALIATALAITGVITKTPNSIASSIATVPPTAAISVEAVLTRISGINLEWELLIIELKLTVLFLSSWVAFS